MSGLANVFRLGVKELWSLVRDPIMLVLIVYTFSISVYTAATSLPEALHKAPIAVVDEDASPLSRRSAHARPRSCAATRPMSPTTVFGAVGGRWPARASY